MATYRIECAHCQETSFMTTRPPIPRADGVVPRPALRCCPCCGRSDRMRVYAQARRPMDYHDHVRAVWHADRLPIPGQAWHRIQADIRRWTPATPGTPAAPAARAEPQPGAHAPPAPAAAAPRAPPVRAQAVRPAPAARSA